MAEKLTPEAQQAFNLQRGTQVALIEREEARVAALQKRAAELALEFAEEDRKAEDEELKRLAKEAKAKPGDTGDSIAPADSKAVTEKAKVENQG